MDSIQGYEWEESGGKSVEMGVQYPPHPPGLPAQAPGSKPTNSSKLAYLGHIQTPHSYSKITFMDLNCSSLHANSGLN